MADVSNNSKRFRGSLEPLTPSLQPPFIFLSNLHFFIEILPIFRELAHTPGKNTGSDRQHNSHS